MDYRRLQYNELKSRLEEPRRRMQVVVGPRQVGKSTLIGQVLDDTPLPYDSYSADDVSNVGPGWISEIWEACRLRMSARGEKRRLLVIDEIQKIVNWSETVKAEWDRDTREKRDIMVVLLGSSRMLIERGLTESLAGRFELLRLTHWSYSEMHDCFGWSLQQYVYFGGYPGAAELIVNEQRWRSYVKDSLIEPSIARDVLLNTNIQKPQLLRQLFELGCGYSGELLSLTKLLAQLQDSGNVTTLAGYLHLLDECELLCGLQKYAADAARKYQAVPKYQLFNNALRNVYLDESYEEVVESPRLWGRYAESAVGAYLVSQSAMCDYRVYYWRDSKDEVDFVLKRRNKLVAIEVKSGRRTTNTGLSKFAVQYKPHRSVVVGSGGISFEEFLSMDLNLLFAGQ